MQFSFIFKAFQTDLPGFSLCGLALKK